MKDELHIEAFCLGAWGTNCYVVHLGEACWIVDVGFEPEPMVAYIQHHKLTPQQVVLTHAHVDHIGGLATIREQWPNLPIVIHEAEASFLTDTALNLSLYLDQPMVAPEATDTLRHGQALTLDGCTFEVRHTPGHSPGGIALVQPDFDVAICGDTLFAGSIGRYDFPTSDGRKLLQSIHEQLLTLPDDTQVLPGHGPATTIGKERQSNPYLQTA